MLTRNGALTCLAALLALTPIPCAARTPTPSFTITGSNVTMPPSGTATFPFTLTSVNGFAGNISVMPAQPAVPAGVRLPYLEIPGPVHAFVLTANGTTTGTFGILAAIPVPVPVRWNLPPRPDLGERAIWSLAGALLLGVGLRKKRALATHLLLAAGMLVGLTAISACGGQPTLTPGTYTYTLTATEVNNTSATANTTVTVTVPPGIVTNN